MKVILIRAVLLASVAVAASACGDSHDRTQTILRVNPYRPGDGGIDLQHGEVVIRAGGTTQDARVGADGSLRIGAEPVEISAAGRAALRQYDAEAIAIKDHGVALGVAGAKFGWRTVTEIFRGLFHGDTEEAGRRADEGAKALVASAHELCSRIDSMYQAQQSAAAAIPAFKPYAVISQRQVDDCLHDDDFKDDTPRDAAAGSAVMRQPAPAVSSRAA